jgi:hypothetical protein
MTLYDIDLRKLITLPIASEERLQMSMRMKRDSVKAFVIATGSGICLTNLSLHEIDALRMVVR